jgi:hypothetical protein
MTFRYLRLPKDFRPSKAEVILTLLVIVIALFLGLTS